MQVAQRHDHSGAFHLAVHVEPLDEACLLAPAPFRVPYPFRRVDFRPLREEVIEQAQTAVRLACGQQVKSIRAWPQLYRAMPRPRVHRFAEGYFDAVEERALLRSAADAQNRVEPFSCDVLRHDDRRAGDVDVPRDHVAKVDEFLWDAALPAERARKHRVFVDAQAQRIHRRAQFAEVVRYPGNRLEVAAHLRRHRWAHQRARPERRDHYRPIPVIEVWPRPCRRFRARCFRLESEGARLNRNGAVRRRPGETAVPVIARRFETARKRPFDGGARRSSRAAAPHEGLVAVGDAHAMLRVPGIKPRRSLDADRVPVARQVEHIEVRLDRDWIGAVRRAKRDQRRGRRREIDLDARRIPVATIV